VLLLKTGELPEHKNDSVLFKLDDKHSFKHKFGTPHTKSFEIAIDKSENVKTIVDNISAACNQRFLGWQSPTCWWSVSKADEKLSELAALVVSLQAEVKALKETVAEHEKLLKSQDKGKGKK